MRRRFRLLDTVVAVDTESREVGDLLGALWSPFATGEDGEAGMVLRVDGDAAQGWSVAGKGDAESSHPDVWNLVDVLRHHMLSDVGSTLEGFAVLHAAGVSRGPRTVLLPGRSGSGKTTLTRALLDAGWSYLTDDLVPIETRTGLAHPFPKPLGVKDGSQWRSLASRLAGVADLPEPTGTFLVPATAWPVATEPSRPSHVIFPRFDPNEAPAVEALGAAEAAARATLYLRSGDSEGLSAMVAVCSHCDCFDLRYGSSAEAVQAVEQAVLGGTT